MKKKNLFGLLLMAMVISLGFTSCEKDEGSEGIEFRMRNSGTWELELLKIDGVFYIDDYYSTEALLGIDLANNFFVTYYGPYTEDCSITCVGSVSNIRKINRIPESGWANAVSVKPGNGYIICHKSSAYNSKYCRYARVYVEDWIESTDGGIIGAIIRYQDNWKIED